MNLIDLIMMLGGLTAALALGVFCGLGLIVWLSGSKLPPPRP